MFIAVYEFEIKDGAEDRFRAAWLEVTKVIYQHCGSYGSRLHTSDKPNVMIGYAQWPTREQWEKEHEIKSAIYHTAFADMHSCLVQMNTVYQLEVCDDYLQSALAMEVQQEAY
jgi:hypothetical protein